MRKAGLTERDIADVWRDVNWTIRGAVRKPEGWKTPGESLMEEWEERIASSSMAEQDLRAKRLRPAKDTPRQLRNRERDFRIIMGDGGRSQ